MDAKCIAALILYDSFTLITQYYVILRHFLS